MTAFWPRRRVLVTGGAGFLGSHVVERLNAVGATVLAPRRSECDLLDHGALDRVLADFTPDQVIHLAATVGGIGANRDNPGRFFYENAMMGMTLIESARRHAVAKTIVLGTVCAYPKFTAVPFREDDLWLGYPEETNAPYGIAKKALLVQLQSYRQQYGMNGIFLIPVNLYGPKDNFDPRSSHVIPALIRKILHARNASEPSVEIWGSGRASREFLYVDDCARAVLLAAERYDGAEPVNLGTGDEINIADLARLIADTCGYAGDLRFNASYPDGQPRRKLDTTRAEKEFGFRAEVGFREGLRRAIDWYAKLLAAEEETVPVHDVPRTSPLQESRA
jgi:GDP-L-fucose synthase